MSRKVFKQFFYTFIYSKFTYAITCYGSAYQNQTQRVKNLVDRALKLTLNRSTLAPEICKNERIFNFDMAYRFNCGINMYRILCLGNHNFLATKVLSYQTNHPHGTRSVSNRILNLPLRRRSKYQRSFLYNGLTWSNLGAPGFFLGVVVCKSCFFFQLMHEPWSRTRASSLWDIRQICSICASHDSLHKQSAVGWAGMFII